MLVGCSSLPSNYKFNNLDDTQVMNFIKQTNNIKTYRNSDVLDYSYKIPTKQWINEKFTPFYSDFLFKYSLNTYYEDKNNCNKYTQYALTCGHILFKNEKDSTSGALAIGQFRYFKGLDRHSIIFFIVNDNGENKLLFYEPQIQQLITLTEEQLRLCTDWSM